MQNEMKTESASAKIKCWVELYSDSMYSWAFTKTSSKETAEDIVQETFLAAFKSFDSYNNKSLPKTWLFSILNNKIIDHYRKKSRNFETSTDNELISEKTTDALFSADESWEKKTLTSWHEDEHLLDNKDFNLILSICIGKLPDNWRLAIESKYQEDKKPTEICKELNITPSNYWQMIHRAKLQLKICIEKNWSN